MSVHSEDPQADASSSTQPAPDVSLHHPQALRRQKSVCDALPSCLFGDIKMDPRTPIYCSGSRSTPIRRPCSARSPDPDPGAADCPVTCRAARFPMPASPPFGCSPFHPRCPCALAAACGWSSVISWNCSTSPGWSRMVEAEREAERTMIGPWDIRAYPGAGAGRVLRPAALAGERLLRGSTRPVGKSDRAEQYVFFFFFVCSRFAFNISSTVLSLLSVPPPQRIPIISRVWAACRRSYSPTSTKFYRNHLTQLLHMPEHRL